MKDIFIRLNAAVKMKLGICCSKGCHRKATADIYISAIKTKRCLCNKHLLDFQKMNLKSHIENK